MPKSVANRTPTRKTTRMMTRLARAAPTGSDAALLRAMRHAALEITCVPCGQSLNSSRIGPDVQRQLSSFIRTHRLVYAALREPCVRTARGITLAPRPGSKGRDCRDHRGRGGAPSINPTAPAASTASRSDALRSRAAIGDVGVGRRRSISQRALNGFVFRGPTLAGPPNSGPEDGATQAMGSFLRDDVTRQQ